MDDQTGTRGSRGVVMVDVARLAGVSQKTVSRVVNDAPYVRPDVRERGARGRSRSSATGRTSPPRRWPGNGPTRSACWPWARGCYGPLAADLHPRARSAPAAATPWHLVSLPDLSAAASPTAWPTLAQAWRRRPGRRGPEPPGRVRPQPARRHPGGHQRRLDRRDRASSRHRRRPGAGSAGELTEHLLGLGHETVWHIAGPRDWDAAAEASARAGARPLRAAGRRVPRVLYGDWSARAGLPSRAASSPSAPTSRRSSRPTTTWRWA